MMKLERMRGLTAAQLRRTVSLSLRLQALLLLVIITSMQKLQPLKVSISSLCASGRFTSATISQDSFLIYTEIKPLGSCAAFEGVHHLSQEKAKVFYLNCILS